MKATIRRVTIPTRLRFAVLNRDGYACRYCRTQAGPFHLDHVRPWSWGGSDTLENLVTACAPCNRRKSAEQWIPLPVPNSLSVIERRETLERIASELGHRPRWWPVGAIRAVWVCSCSRSERHWVPDCAALMPAITEHLAEAIAAPLELGDDEGPPMFMEWKPVRQRTCT